MLTKFVRISACVTFRWQQIVPLPIRTISVKRIDSQSPSNSLLNPIFVNSTRWYSDEAGSEHVETVGDLVRSHRIVVFMKGNPDEPRCGFSNAVCRILEMHGVLDQARKDKTSNLFASYDVLESEELRSAAKVFADWPTFPQVYFDGEFIGGCDILLDMHRSGKLADELENRGIPSLLKDKKTENEK
ncbi:Monothiol glutaredoxin-mitochondrial [Fasciolopsis buskii]|uniref:Monothiol glutaredoxin-mitochondrial n=1 Tax=Fasciolopsis buskii TaxID=27845 RepID=A0A8E0RJN0_9TREM|nr:Monothiol glutaredoxin-mitochondrial [Fasciolopsis buski]